MCAAEADLRSRISPGQLVERVAALLSWIARQAMDADQRSRCLGTVYELRSGDSQHNAIEMLREGTVTCWRG